MQTADWVCSWWCRHDQNLEFVSRARTDQIRRREVCQRAATGDEQFKPKYSYHP